MNCGFRTFQTCSANGKWRSCFPLGGWGRKVTDWHHCQGGEMENEVFLFGNTGCKTHEWWPEQGHFSLLSFSLRNSTPPTASLCSLAKKGLWGVKLKAPDSLSCQEALPCCSSSANKEHLQGNIHCYLADFPSWALQRWTLAVSP